MKVDNWNSFLRKSSENRSNRRFASLQNRLLLSYLPLAGKLEKNEKESETNRIS